jgi:cysteinyl-tRNA synthetase
MEKLKLYNTLKRKKETFKPIITGNVSLYTCGPTVYWYQHIGNLRSYIFSDLLKRTLIYNNLKVNHVMNVTDVGHLTSDSDIGEDKMEISAQKEKKSPQEIASFYLKIFQQDLKKLNILPPNKFTKATEHIKEQISLISKLEKKGFTYKTSDGIYYNTSKFPSYPNLAKLNIKNLKAGKRISIGEKKNKTDFALWKFSYPPSSRLQEWDSPWGVGFPGWHIECSAMSMKHLGNHFDIHTGGEDHIPIHHTNEIAQSEAATGKKFVNYWLHGAFLKFKGEKVSKSTGGLYTISELEKEGYSPLDFRYLTLQTHYRKPLNFTIENLEAAKTALQRIQRKIINLKKAPHKESDLTKKYESQFLEAINDDLNLPQALKVLWKTLDDPQFDTKIKLALIYKFDTVFGLSLKGAKEHSVSPPHKVKKLLESRELLRKNKKWAEADIVRQRILESGFSVQDTEKGPRLEKI